MVERLRCTRHQTDIIDDQAVRGCERLDQLHDREASHAGRRHERIDGHRLGWLRVEAPEMNDARQVRRLFPDALKQAPHVVGIAAADAEMLCSIVPKLGAVRHPEHTVSAFFELAGQLRAGAWTVGDAGVGEQQPSLRPFGRFRDQFRRCGQLRAACDDHRMLGAFGRRTVSNANRVAEAGVAQQARPGLLGNTGLVPPDIIVEQPPAFQQSEDQRHEQPGMRQLDEDEHPARPEQLLEAAERLAQVRRGMEDVRRDDQVERMRVKTLFERVTLDIERLAAQERKLCKLVLCMRSEAGRDVGEYILGAMLRQNGKDKARRPAGSAADFQNSQPLSLWKASNHLSNRFLHQKIIEAEAR